MKKVLLATFISFTLIGCGDNDSNPAPSQPLKPQFDACSQVYLADGTIVDLIEKVTEDDNGLFYKKETKQGYVDSYGNFVLHRTCKDEPALVVENQYKGYEKNTVNGWFVNGDYFRGSDKPSMTDEAKIGNDYFQVTNIYRKNRGEVIDRGDQPNKETIVMKGDKPLYTVSQSWEIRDCSDRNSYIDDYCESPINLHRVNAPSKKYYDDNGKIITIDWNNEGLQIKSKNFGDNNTSCAWYSEDGNSVWRDGVDGHCYEEKQLDEKYLVWDKQEIKHPILNQETVKAFIDAGISYGDIYAICTDTDLIDVSCGFSLSWNSGTDEAIYKPQISFSLQSYIEKEIITTEAFEISAGKPRINYNEYGDNNLDVYFRMDVKTNRMDNTYLRPKDGSSDPLLIATNIMGNETIIVAKDDSGYCYKSPDTNNEPYVYCNAKRTIDINKVDFNGLINLQANQLYVIENTQSMEVINLGDVIYTTKSEDFFSEAGKRLAIIQSTSK